MFEIYLYIVVPNNLHFLRSFSATYLSEGPFLVLEEDARFVRMSSGIFSENFREGQILPLVSFHLDQEPEVAVQSAANERKAIAVVTKINCTRRK